jgi:hypothetical protein
VAVYGSVTDTWKVVRELAMNTTLFNADAGTHLKIIVVAPLGAIVVVWASIAAHLGTDKVIRLQSHSSIETPSTPAVDPSRGSSLMF